MVLPTALEKPGHISTGQRLLVDRCNELLLNSAVPLTAVEVVLNGSAGINEVHLLLPLLPTGDVVRIGHYLDLTIGQPSSKVCLPDQCRAALDVAAKVASVGLTLIYRVDFTAFPLMTWRLHVCCQSGPAEHTTMAM